MPLNWVEQLVVDLHKLRGYAVETNVDLLMPKSATRKVRGHSDIDVLAGNGSEVRHIECQTWWGPDRSEEPRELGRLLSRFHEGEKLVRQRWPFLFPRNRQTPYRRLFVVGGRPQRSTGKGPFDRLDAFASKHGIKMWDLNTVVDEFLDQLKASFPKKDQVGKLVGQAGLLLYLQKEDWFDR